MNKLYTALLIAHERQLIPSAQAIRQQQLILLALARRVVAKHTLKALLRPNFGEDEKQSITNEFLKSLDEYYTLSQLRTSFANKFEELLKGQQRGVTLAHKALTERCDGITYHFIEQASEVFFKSPLPADLFAFFLRHTADHEFDYLQHEVDLNRDTLNSAVLSHIDLKNIIHVPGYSDIYKIVDERYARQFAERHF